MQALKYGNNILDEHGQKSGEATTLEHWKNCSRRPKMRYEIIGEPRPQPGDEDFEWLTTVFGGNFVWYVQGYWDIPATTILSTQGNHNIRADVEVSGDPTLMMGNLANPNLPPNSGYPYQSIKYCPDAPQYNEATDGWATSPGYATVGMPSISIYPVTSMSNSYDGVAFNPEKFRTSGSGMEGGRGSQVKTYAYWVHGCGACPPGSQYNTDTHKCEVMVDETDPCTGNKHWVKLNFNLYDPDKGTLSGGEI
jgi:hypothetical protein